MENPRPDILTDVAVWSSATFLSSVAVAYIACMCKGQEVSEVKSIER